MTDATPAHTDRLTAWVAALEARHLAHLRFSEVSRALRALSSAYVERRTRLSQGAALDGGGKRAAFALSYGPLHFVTVRAILAAVSADAPRLDTIVDMGCGTGAAGAAWAEILGGRAQVLGIDRHQWAVAEAAWTYRFFGIRARTRQADLLAVPLPSRRTGIVAGWVANELSGEARTALRERLAAARRQGATILVVEPIARAVTPWWAEWVERFAGGGSRADEWRFRIELPDPVRRLDRAAGLNREEVTARSLWAPAAPRPHRSVHGLERPTNDAEH
jgi:hypothetical protein